MRSIEADWIRERLLAAGAERVSPLANIGSSTAWFREVRKPYIEKRLFRPLREAGIEIVHIDMKAEDGVDVVADLSDPAVVAELSSRGFRSVICSNLLEHVEARSAVARTCERLVSDGVMVVTVPHSYPYHPDPIDTLYRPTPEELGQLFTQSRLVESAILSDGTVLDEETAHGKGHLALLPLRWGWLLFSGLWRPKIGRAAAARIAHLFKPISVTCAVFERNSAAR